MFDSIRSLIRLQEIEWDATERRLSRAANIADLRNIARRRLPGGVFDYIDGAAEDERSARRNVAAFGDYEFRPAVLRDISHIDTSATLFGAHLSMPLVVAPMGFMRIAHPLGELAVAEEAARAGVPFTLSTFGTRSIEEVAAAGEGTKWFQVYVWRDRGLVRELLDRAGQAGYQAIAITVDTAVLGRRERDVRRGFTLPPRVGPATLVEGALRPGWTWELVRADPIRFANLIHRDQGDGVDPVSLAAHANRHFDGSLSWSDIDWFREVWPGPIIVKGVQSVADAVRCVDAGVEAVCLSNHGGRQLDGSPAPVELIEPVVEAVEGKAAVISDGGVRRGSDIVKALALGADAVMAGRAFYYGLGAAGQRGVEFALATLREEMERVMALIGVTSVKELDRARIRHLPTEPI